MIRIHFPSMDTDPFSIHGSRSIFPMDPDPFFIHWSRIRIFFPSMDRESAYIFHPWIQDPDPRLNELILTTLTMQFLRILKLFVFFFWGILLGFFVKKINLLCLYDSFYQFWRYFYFILLFWELWGVRKRQCFFLWKLAARVSVFGHYCIKPFIYPSCLVRRRHQRIQGLCVMYKIYIHTSGLKLKLLVMGPTLQCSLENLKSYIKSKVIVVFYNFIDWFIFIRLGFVPKC